MINIVVPIAGSSYFFNEDKDGFPKPFIEVCGKTMLQHCIENYSGIKDKQFIFILKDSENRRFHIDSAISVLTDNSAKVIVLKNETQGMACSVMMAVDFINNDTPLLMVNMDQILRLELNPIIERLSAYDSGVLSVESIHPRWAYVRCDESGFVIQAYEKQPVSRNAIAGFYFFKKGRYFMESAKRMIKKDMNYEGKYFVSPVLNELILENKKVFNIPIDKSCYHTFYSKDKIKDYERIFNA